MKNIIISIQPKWCELIASGKKTIEVRKTAPKAPFMAFIYETKGKIEGEPWMDEDGHTSFRGRGKVIGEFICDKVDKYEYTSYGYGESISEEDFNKTGMTISEFCDYGKQKTLYGLHITNLKIYDEPKELGEFYSVQQCKPCKSFLGYQWTWEDRHKRNNGGCSNSYRPIPIECYRCKSLVGGKDYLDEKSGCVLFDYECTSNYHKPLEHAPQSWQYIETPDWAKE